VETMAQWFGLAGDRKDFYIENQADARLLFARTDLDERLKALLRRSFRTSNPPKLVLYGDWGVGKTHTMRHMQYEIETNSDYAADVVFVELPDITARTTFQAAHSALLDALGMDRVKVWMSQYQARNPYAFETLQEWTQSADIAKAFSTLIGYGDAARLAWDWLRGIKLSPADARSAGLPPSLEQSHHMVQVLRATGRLAQEIEGRMLVLMLDEATKLTNVTNHDSIAHWVNAFKILSDSLTKEVGLVVSISLRQIEEFPDPLRDQQVQTRFGQEHYIDLPNFREEEAREFMIALLSEWVDDYKESQIIATHPSEADEEDITDTFPFTDPAFDRFIQYACRAVVTTPRDLQKSLDDFLNRAIDEDRHVLSFQFVESIVSGG
jgi:Cdc6-like AAA superfamily ATPase